MSPIRSLAVVCALGLAFTACSSGDGDTAGDTGGDTADNTADKPGTDSPGTFEGENNAVRQDLIENRGDLCGVFANAPVLLEPRNPTSDGEAELVADTLIAFLDALATEAISEFPDESAQLGAAAVGIRDVVDNSTTKPETVSNLSEAAADELSESSEAIYEIAKLCGPPSG